MWICIRKRERSSKLMVMNAVKNERRKDELDFNIKKTQVMP